MISEAFQFFTQAASFENLYKPALILAVTIALIWFLRPGFFMGAVLSIAGLIIVFGVLFQWTDPDVSSKNFVTIVPEENTTPNNAAIDNTSSDLIRLASTKAEIHYRLDVNLLVDGEPLTGSVVQGLSMSRGSEIPILGIGSPTKFYGQALVLDLPGGRPSLIVPMAGGGRLFQQGMTDEEAAYSPMITKESFARLFFFSCGFYTYPRARDWTLGGSETRADWYIRVNNFKGTCEVTPQFMPLLYSIDDDYDVSTIQLANPNSLAARFGSGVEFVSASVSVVDGPVTSGIEKTFPALAEIVGLSTQDIQKLSTAELATVLRRMKTFTDELILKRLKYSDLFRRKPR